MRLERQYLVSVPVRTVTVVRYCLSNCHFKLLVTWSCRSSNIIFFELHKWRKKKNFSCSCVHDLVLKSVHFSTCKISATMYSSSLGTCFISVISESFHASIGLISCQIPGIGKSCIAWVNGSVPLSWWSSDGVSSFKNCYSVSFLNFEHEGTKHVARAISQSQLSGDWSLSTISSLFASDGWMIGLSTSVMLLCKLTSYTDDSDNHFASPCL